MTVLHLDYTSNYMQQPPGHNGGSRKDQKTAKQTMSIGEVVGSTNTEAMGKRPGKRPGRKPSKIDERAKLERSRQSARECRARKKLRYQYLEELVLSREKAVFALRDELEMCKQWCSVLDSGGPVPESLIKAITNREVSRMNQQIRRDQQNLELQQRRQQQQATSPSSHTSSSSSSPPVTTHSGEHHLDASSPQSQIQRYLPNLSPPLQPEQSTSQMQYKRWCSCVDHKEVPEDLREKLISESTTFSLSSPGCSDDIIDFTKDTFNREIPDSHKEET